MSIDSSYLRDERLLVRMAIVLGAVAGLMAFVVMQLVGDRSEVVRAEVAWAYIEEQSTERGLDPAFVYAIAWAESSLDAKAESPVARGLMQLTRVAWEEVSDEPYRKVWNWKTNVDVACDYLVFCREFLQSRGRFSYPLLAAAYRYGPYYVQNQGFELARMKQPSNAIYQRIFAGNTQPVAPPE